MRNGTETRELINAEAMRLFVEKGVHKTSIKNISDAVGVTQGAIYRHYESKEALVSTLFVEPWRDFAVRISEIDGSSIPFRAKIARMVALFCDSFDSNRTLFALLFLVQHDQMKNLPEGDLNPIDAVKTCISRAAASGEIACDDPELATAMIVGIVLQTATFKLYDRIPGPMSQNCPTLVDACLRVIF